MSAVTVSNIHKIYRDNGIPHSVLKGVTLTVEGGQILGIIGRSGAGKSTFLRCLNGLESPDKGEIRVGGQSLTKTSTAFRRNILQKIGTVFQSFNLSSRRTVLENISLPLEFMNISKAERNIKSQHIAALVGLKDKENSYPAQLSGGQRQRVAIGRALATDAPLLICDEFTSALDSETALEILSLLHGLNQKLGITIIMVTHDLLVIREICDQVCVMDKGKIVESGSVEDILLKPAHSVTRSLVKNLFMKDLPQKIQENLMQVSSGSDHAVLRLIFSNTCAHQPVVASMIEKFKIPVNIIAGNIDHVRETAFGSLVVTLPCRASSKSRPVLAQIQAHFHKNHVSSEILGFIQPYD
jgi:D-methionine transport system ATP-binding protein